MSTLNVVVLGAHGLAGPGAAAVDRVPFAQEGGEAGPDGSGQGLGRVAVVQLFNLGGDRNQLGKMRAGF